MRRRERGEINFGCVFSFVVFALLVYLGLKIIPVKVASAEFYDTMTEIAEKASLLKDKEMRYQIMQKAKELEIPLEDEDLTIQRESGHVTIEAAYVMEVDFNGMYLYEWDFDYRVRRQLF